MDDIGSRLYGGRWNSAGHGVVYASDSFAGAILEILVHALRPRTLPGAHHAVELSIPTSLIEIADVLQEWDEEDSLSARDFGDSWLSERRSAVLSVPSLPSRPVGRTIMVNRRHPDASTIDVSSPFDVPWDERLLGSE